MVFCGLVTWSEKLMTYFCPAGVAGVKSAGAAHMRMSFAVVEDALSSGPFLCGAALTMADVYLAMLTAWSPEPITSRRVQAVVQAVAADPQIAPLWLRHGFAK